MKKVLVFLLLVTTSISFAQTDTKITTFGYVRTFHETNFKTDASRFRIRMARLGFKGKLNEQLSYKLFVDFARMGKFVANIDSVNGVPVITNASATFSNYLLDAFVAYKPTDYFTFTIGQQKIPFGSDNLLAASKIPFSNRPLLAAATPGLRDLGAIGAFNFNIGIPVDVYVGFFNGVSLNKSEDDRTTNYSTRLVLKPIKGINISANYYSGRFLNNDTDFMNFGAGYKFGNLWAAGEYSIKKVETTSTKTTNAYFAYVVYDIPTNNEYLTYVQPGLRVGSFDPDDVINDDETLRYTIGLTFQFTKKRSTHFRVNYEKYDLANDDTNPDKLTLEFQVKF